MEEILTSHFALILLLLPLFAGWVLDCLLGDPSWLPHPVVGFGKMIDFGEHRLNKGRHRRLKGAVLAVGLILAVFFATHLLRRLLHALPAPIGGVSGEMLLGGASGEMLLGEVSGVGLLLFDTLVVFFCLAGTTLIREVRAVFEAVDRSLDEGRRQVARIVGRDTSELSAQEVRTAALETLAENLSDGVIAPLFWFALLGTPGMLAYKMVNTLDSMIGYRTERYRRFGTVAARIDDVANYIPARLTALLMILSSFLLPRSSFLAPRSSLLAPPSSLLAPRSSLFTFVRHYGRNHASPNSGWPEAALAGILNCRFGGPHYYFGQLFPKPYIGDNDRPLTTDDMKLAVRVNRTAEVLMVLLTAAALYFIGQWWW